MIGSIRAARQAGIPIYDLLGLGFTEDKHVTSFSIGIDSQTQSIDQVDFQVKIIQRDPVFEIPIESISLLH